VLFACAYDAACGMEGSTHDADFIKAEQSGAVHSPVPSKRAIVPDRNGRKPELRRLIHRPQLR
jgi:hypothetical protein